MGDLNSLDGFFKQGKRKAGQPLTVLLLLCFVSHMWPV